RTRDGTLTARLPSASEIARDRPIGSGNPCRIAFVAGAAPAVLQSLPPARAAASRAADSWSMGTRLALVWVFETHRLQFGENCADENLGLDAKYEPLRIV